MEPNREHDAMRHWEAWAARARSEEMPEVDVRAQVLHRLRAEDARAPDRTLEWFAFGACAVAAVLTAVTLPVLDLLSDPMMGLFELTPTVPL